MYLCLIFEGEGTLLEHDRLDAEEVVRYAERTGSELDKRWALASQKERRSGGRKRQKIKGALSWSRQHTKLNSSRRIFKVAAWAKIGKPKIQRNARRRATAVSQLSRKRKPVHDLSARARDCN